MLNIFKALTSNKWGKQKELSIFIFKAMIRLYWNVKTQYGAKKTQYQIPTSRNCTPFKTQLCLLILVLD